jgi:hypothetical protein
MAQRKWKQSTREQTNGAWGWVCWRWDVWVDEMMITIFGLAVATAIVAFIVGIWVGRRRGVRHWLDTEKAKREINEYCRRAEPATSVVRPT